MQSVAPSRWTVEINVQQVEQQHYASLPFPPHPHDHRRSYEASPLELLPYYDDRLQSGNYGPVHGKNNPDGPHTTQAYLRSPATPPPLVSPQQDSVQPPPTCTAAMPLPLPRSPSQGNGNVCCTPSPPRRADKKRYRTIPPPPGLLRSPERLNRRIADLQELSPSPVYRGRGNGGPYSQSQQSHHGWAPQQQQQLQHQPGDDGNRQFGAGQSNSGYQEATGTGAQPLGFMLWLSTFEVNSTGLEGLL